MSFTADEQINIRRRYSTSNIDYNPYTLGQSRATLIHLREKYEICIYSHIDYKLSLLCDYPTKQDAEGNSKIIIPAECNSCKKVHSSMGKKYIPKDDFLVVPVNMQNKTHTLPCFCNHCGQTYEYDITDNVTKSFAEADESLKQSLLKYPETTVKYNSIPKCPYCANKDKTTLTTPTTVPILKALCNKGYETYDYFYENNYYHDFWFCIDDESGELTTFFEKEVKEKGYDFFPCLRIFAVHPTKEVILTTKYEITIPDLEAYLSQLSTYITENFPDKNNRN